MNIVVTLVAVIVVATGIYFSQKSKQNEEQIEIRTQEVLSDETQDTPTPSAIPTKIPTAIPQPTNAPTAKPQDSSSAIPDFKYPNSNITSSSQNSLSMESSDTSDAITNWYKNKINSMGMNVKTFVTTSANEKVLNKLVGADGSREIRIEISQENNSSKVKISVEFNKHQ